MRPYYNRLKVAAVGGISRQQQICFSICLDLFLRSCHADFACWFSLSLVCLVSTKIGKTKKENQGKRARKGQTRLSVIKDMTVWTGTSSGARNNFDIFFSSSPKISEDDDTKTGKTRIWHEEKEREKKELFYFYGSKGGDYSANHMVHELFLRPRTTDYRYRSPCVVLCRP